MKKLKLITRKVLDNISYTSGNCPHCGSTNIDSDSFGFFCLDCGERL